MHAALQGSQHDLHISDTHFGCLCHNFNTQLDWAYNRREELKLTHFAMLHSDISTVKGCFDILVEEMEKYDADFMGTTVAIGDDRRLTSTGVHAPDIPNVRRLTVKEVQKLPETFSADDVEPGSILAVNTGLWLMRFDVGVWRKFPGFHTIHRRVYKPECDQFESEFRSEDWNFADWMHEQKLKVMITRKVWTGHHKTVCWDNENTTTGWDYDREFTFAPPSGEESHLGGCTLPTTVTPNGDPMSWCPTIWQYFTSLPGQTVLDIGCGAGFSARWFEEHGAVVTGIEADLRAINSYKGKSLIRHDFTRGPAPLTEDYDVAWCCEFVEHVDSKYESFILDAFAHAEMVVMTHALPGDPGTHHVNCQTDEYWIKRMESIGHEYCEHLTNYYRALAPGTYFARSGLVFVRRAQ